MTERPDSARPGHPSAGEPHRTTTDQELPPEHVLTAALVAYRLRRPDAVPADLLADSAADPPPGLRAALDGGPRLLAFGAAGVELRLQVTVRDDGCDVVGQLIPPVPYTVQVRSPNGAVRHASDPDGAFILPNLPRGPLSLVCSPSPATPDPPLAMPWTVL